MMTEQNEIGEVSLHNILRLMSASDGVERYLGTELRQNGTSPIRWSVLYSILGSGGAMTPSELSQQLTRAPHAITSVIDTLEREGLVRRKPNRKDRRSNSIVLTKNGEESIRDMIPLAKRMSSELLSCFNDKEIELFMSYLKRIKEHTKQLDSERAVSQHNK